MNESELFERLRKARDRQSVVTEALQSGVSEAVIREMLDYLEYAEVRSVSQGDKSDRLSDVIAVVLIVTSILVASFVMFGRG